MTANQLRNHPTVLRLVALQEQLALKDGAFKAQIRFRIHAANWGKIKAKTYTGRFQNALDDLTVALADYEGSGGSGEVEDGIVILDNTRQVLDAVDIAKDADDEHRLVIMSGVKGSGKSRTLSLVKSRHKAVVLSARPSWSGSYLTFLNNYATGIGLGESRSAGGAESLILKHHAENPGVLGLDEFNHFSAPAINFIKTILNETPQVIVAATIPYHLSRMASESKTSQEAAQLLRRSVAIVHFKLVSVRDVELFQRAMYPELPVAGYATAIAACANKLNRMDSVCQILADADEPSEIPGAIARHERACMHTLKPGEN